jgi:hypothetical protein
MNERLLDILKPQGDCIPEEMLLRYAKGTLAADDSRRVEEHVTECELCSDALDGIMKSGDVQHFRARIISAKQSLRKKTGVGEERRMFPFTRATAVAATVLLLAVSAWFVQYLIQDESQKVFTDQFKPFPAEKMDSLVLPQVTPAISESTLAQQETYEHSAAEEKPVKEVAKKTEAVEKDVLAQAEAAPEFAAPAEEQHLDQMQSTRNDQREERDVHKNAAAPEAASRGMAKEEAVAPDQSVVSGQANKRAGATPADEEAIRKSQMISDYLNRGMAYYGSERYAEALAEFQLVLKEDPSNATANFYSGVSALALDDPKKAISYFKETDNRNNQYYEATLWYEALANVKLGNKKEATRLLEKIIGLNGQYKSQAEQTLKEL